MSSALAQLVADRAEGLTNPALELRSQVLRTLAQQIASSGKPITWWMKKLQLSRYKLNAIQEGHLGSFNLEDLIIWSTRADLIINLTIVEGKRP